MIRSLKLKTRICVSKLFKKMGHIFDNLAVQFYQPPYTDKLNKWLADNGDKTHRLLYDLDVNSLVLDVGGFEGQWSSDIYSKYLCKIHIFEPVQLYCQKIKDRFEKNPDLIVHEFGLANHSKMLTINVNEDSSSLCRLSNNKEMVQVVKAADFFIKNQIKTVDLIKINIEGAEYDLLEHLLDSDWVKKIKNIQVQFHSFVPEAELRMKVIQNRLSDTHELTYSYTFVWENWKLKE